MDPSARANRNIFEAQGVAAVTFLSAPRAGKTSILERILPVLKADFAIAVIAGDLYAPFDAERIRAAGVPVWQITGGADKRIDAARIARALGQFPLGGRDLIIIESVVDLASRHPDLGEDLRIIICVFEEGMEIARHNPELWRTADAIVLNKIDLVPYPRVALNQFTTEVRRAASVPVFAVSCHSGEGVLEWTRWLGDRVRGIGRSRAMITTASSRG